MVVSMVDTTAFRPPGGCGHWDTKWNSALTHIVDYKAMCTDLKPPFVAFRVL